MERTCRFSETPLPALADVGGKGLSLIRLYQAGLPVPNGFVLTGAFFTPWMALLKATAAWQTFLAANDAGLREACQRLQDISKRYELTAEQRACLQDALGTFTEQTLYAVRSSSPEEDGTRASFAGCYETVLGVPPDRLEAAIHQVFASCLDARIVVYKRTHGFDARDPHLAIVVQEQIAGEVSGVGFSVHPCTGDPHQAVYESNWGLGETVVSGKVTPDYFIVHKPTRMILERRVGAKERAVVLCANGGTREWEDPRYDQLSLQDGQLQALTEVLIALEHHYGHAIDMEWTFADGRLSMLQARPITTPHTAPRTASAKISVAIPHSSD